VNNLPKVMQCARVDPRTFRSSVWPITKPQRLGGEALNRLDMMMMYVNIC